MDSWEFNKIAAAVLAALLIIVGGKTLVELGTGGHGGGHAVKAGFVLPVTNAGGSGQAGKEEKKGFDPAVVVAAIAKADPKAGEALFKRCHTCHTDTKGGKNAVGPNLWGLVNRKKAAHEGFNYSKAMTEKGGEWDYAALADFVHSPKKFVPGTKMAFAGLKDPTDLANLIAYLRMQADTPAPLPVAAPAPAEAPKPAAAAPAETPKPAAPAAAPQDKPAQEKPAQEPKKP